MKIAIKRERRILPAGQAENASPTPETETSTEVPTSTVVKASGLITAVLAAGLTGSQILSNVLSSLTGSSSNRAQIEISKERVALVDENFRVQLLQRILEEPDGQKRAQSLKLVLASGLLKDSDGKLTKLVDTANYIPPQWGVRPLEPLKETLPMTSGNITTQTNPPGQTGAGTGTNQTGAGSGTNKTTNTSGGDNPNPNPQPNPTNTSGNTSTK